MFFFIFLSVWLILTFVYSNHQKSRSFQENCKFQNDITTYNVANYTQNKNQIRPNDLIGRIMDKRIFNKKRKKGVKPPSKLSTSANDSRVLSFPNFGLKILRGKLLSADGSASHYSGIVFETGQSVDIAEWRLLKRKVQRNCPISTCSSRTFDIDCKEHTLVEICSYVEQSIRNTQNLRFLCSTLPSYECISFRETKNNLIVTVVESSVQGIDLVTLGTRAEVNEKLLTDIAKHLIHPIYLVHSLFESDQVWLSDESIVIENFSGHLRFKNPSIFKLLWKWAGHTYQKIDDNNWTALSNILEKYSAKLEISAHMKDFIQICKKTTSYDLSTIKLLQAHPFLASQPRMANISLQSQLSSEKSRIAKEYEVIERLGQGGFGCVVKAQNKLDKNIYAIKRIGIPAIDDTRCEKILKEAEYLSKVQHENVVNYSYSWIEHNEEDQNGSKKLYEYEEDDEYDCSESETQTSRGIVLDPDSFDTSVRIEKTFSKKSAGERKKPTPPSFFLCIQMEYCGRITLREAIDAKLLIRRRKQLHDFAKQINEGLAHIHSKRIIHRDLNPKNIFLTLNLDRIKIGDFGLATETFVPRGPIDNLAHSDVIASLTSNVGTPLYTAPELTNPAKPKYTKQIDLYSFGVILFEMFSPPFYSKMERSKVIEALRKHAKSFPKDCKIQWKARQLISKLLSHDPNQRPESNEIRATLISIKNEEFNIRLKNSRKLKLEDIKSLID